MKNCKVWGIVLGLLIAAIFFALLYVLDSLIEKVDQMKLEANQTRLEVGQTRLEISEIRTMLEQADILDWHKEGDLIYVEPATSTSTEVQQVW